MMNNSDRDSIQLNNPSRGWLNNYFPFGIHEYFPNLRLITESVNHHFTLNPGY